MTKRLRIEDILKPGANWEVKKVDFNDSEVIKTLERCKQAQEESRERKRYRPELMRQVITI
jgi:hypothetical protein